MCDNFFLFDTFFFIPFNDELQPNIKFLNLNNFIIFPIVTNYYYFEESYDNFKNFNFIFNNSNQLILNFSNFFFPFSSSFDVFNTFRSNYQEFSWTSNFFSQPLQNTFYFNNYFINLRSNYFYNIRNTTKNSIVNFNALQKVFKTRLDESRSNSRLEDFNKMFLSSTTQPFINSSRPSYEKIIGKTQHSFYKLNFYKNYFSKNFSNIATFNNSLNFFFFDFPFLLSYKSDPSRYLWIDWFSKWGFYEVQPSSSSKYSLQGMPYFNKFFEFNYDQNENLNETETYFIRISKARKNYPVSWAYSPFFYFKNLAWYPHFNFFFYLNNDILNNIFFQFDNFSWYWEKNNVTSSFSFPISNSNFFSFARSSGMSYVGVSYYFNSLATLTDYLTKKEYLYRKLFFSNNTIYNLPTNLTSSPNNLLLNEIKTLFNYTDPILVNNEFSKYVFYTSLEFFNSEYLKTFNKFYKNSFLNFWYSNFTNYYLTSSYNNNYVLFKNPHRPLRKGINNMIRLHGTGAIALPIEIRLQILASSKDVIHSWAVPSAGVKIDCVPGYSSHKVIIFLVSGIFWGQCMEICGRYHHWMPIIVYFMKRDLFFLWCTHFVFLSGSNSPWNINDRQFTDYLRLVSYDKNSWLTEITN